MQQISDLIGCASIRPVANAMKAHGFERRKNGGGKGLNASPRWSGDSVGISAAHARLYRMLGNPSKCEECGTTSAKRYDWANLTGRYNDPKDFKRMCRSCHLKFDYSRGLRSNGR